MSRAHYFYLLSPLPELEKIVEAHQLDFDELVQDTFSVEELTRLESLLDSIGAIFVQPIISELTFDDFYSKEDEAEKQCFFFESCRSSICIENLPDFQNNPFQVTYLIELLRNLGEVLVDTGGVNELVFKKDYLEDLKRHKNIFSLLVQKNEKPKDITTSKPVDPIDFLIIDVYKEIERLTHLNLIDQVMGKIQDQPEKTRKTFLAMKDGRLDADTLLRKSGLNPKDLDDNLEKLKFFLRRS